MNIMMTTVHMIRITAARLMSTGVQVGVHPPRGVSGGVQEGPQVSSRGVQRGPVQDLGQRQLAAAGSNYSSLPIDCSQLCLNLHQIRRRY